MALLSMQDVKLSFGGPPLMDGANLQIEAGERVCLLGRNGAGKSTLMKLIKGEIQPDGGEITKKQSLRVSSLTQDVPKELAGTVFEVIAGGLNEDHHRDGRQEVDKILSLMKLKGEEDFQKLSAGLKRRVLLARGIVSEPHILLLDEPTNHLDIDAIKWLEDFLLRYGGTLLFVTHDRVFLQKLATRIVELDRGRLLSWNCDYKSYLERKEALLDGEASQNAKFDKKLAEEEVWIRKGIKARRTRNEGRVRDLQKMRDERSARRSQTGNVNLKLQEVKRSGKLVMEAENVRCGYEDTTVIESLSTTIMRGDKVGIIGPNGAGKTTLLKTLLGLQPPLEGEIAVGTNMEVAYFDQLRSQLDEEKTVIDNVADGNDMVIINDKPKHIISYLSDFLFTSDRARSPVKILSGGERNRLLLAKLFTKPSNIIVMDEPTNDLDMETLDLLEALLVEYNGTLLLVSHDRAFINNIVTSTLVFEGDGIVEEYVGGYDDWLRQRKAKSKEGSQKTVKSGKKLRRPKKLSFKEKKELEALPEEIEEMEEKKVALYELMADPEIYQEGGDKIADATTEIANIDDKLNIAYKRWEELEAIK